MASHDPTKRWIACAALALGCTHNDFNDPGCAPSSSNGYPVTTVTLARIGLFREDGTAIELPDAIVTCAQGASATERAQYRPEFGVGKALLDGGVVGTSGEGTVFNLYGCGLGSILRRCGAPLRVRVDAPGCEPFERTWTWDDNYAQNGSNSDFIVPVRLRCAGDAGIGPSMRDIPALNRDAGNLPRDGASR
jgi:hypothetical protein